MPQGEERTEKATPRKLRKARSEGSIANTPEFGMWLGLLVASFLLPWVFRSLLNTATGTVIQVGGVIQNPTTSGAIGVASTAFKSAFKSVLVMGGVIAVTGVASVAAQGGLRFTPKLLRPKFSRLNPLSGIKRIFGPQAGWNLAKALLKTAALAVVILLALRPLLPKISSSGTMSVGDLVSTGASTALDLLRAAAVAGLLMACADFAVTRRRNNKQLKMTKQEVKEEFKSQEGDPHVRSARRSRALAMSRNRMMAEIAHADVVVVNPTHVAVALRYDPARGAPRVVAKGADHVAAKIRELAEVHRVPMVSDVPLARTLHATCKLGQEIPPDLYKAVATVLAFIMTLKKRGSAVGVHTVRTLVPTG
jgi:flagellar biosynthesis protein FlhB